MSKSVVIVGGGLVGLSSALFLTEAGADVTIVDSTTLGGGAARGNAGFMCTAIVEPLPAPGAIGNALKALRDPQPALRVLPKAIPAMTPWLLAFARNCTASRYQSGRAALALDLMEELRSVLADRLVLTLINRRQVSATGFTKRSGGAVQMEDAARKEVIVAYQKRKQEEITHPVLDQKMPLGLVPHVQARLLARVLRGDLESYPPFLYR